MKTHRYLLMGKSIHEPVMINNKKSISYAECCQQYLNETSASDKLQIICFKCCDNLQRLHSMHLDAAELTKKLCRNFSKTKRLNRIRRSDLKKDSTIEIKEEPLTIELDVEPVLSNNSYTNNHVQPYDAAKYVKHLSVYWHLLVIHL